MTEHGTLFYMEKILTFALVCAFVICCILFRFAGYPYVKVIIFWLYNGAVTMIQIPTMQRIYPGMVYMFIWRNRLGILL